MNQCQMIEKFTYSSLGKTFEKPTKAIGYQGGKQAEALQSLNNDQQLKSVEDLFWKNLVSTEAKDEIKIIEQYGWEGSIYRTGIKQV